MMLTRQHTIYTFNGLITQWKNPPFIFPAFTVELDFMKFLKEYLEIQPAGDDLRFAAAAERRLEQSLNNAIKPICRTLDQAPADGAAIWTLMDNGKIITRKDLKDYNKQIPTDQSKITTSEWEDYHHWLLAHACWVGFLASFEDTFKITIQDIWYGHPAQFLRPEYRPLFGMLAAVDETGSPCISTRKEKYGDCITLNSNWKNYLSEIL